MNWRPSLLALVVLVLSACGKSGVIDSSGASSLASTADGAGGSCAIPASATVDAGDGAGCKPIDTGKACQVSNGATVLGDGGVANGSESCQSLCDATQYEVQCSNGGPMGGPIPDPDSALGCSGLPLPMPAGVLLYCCPCGG